MKARLEKRSLLDYVALACKGFCMGASDVVPGVSGGTMAFILGIYEELIEAIKSFDLKSLRLLLAFKFKDFFDRIAWQFLLAVGVGILTAIFTLARVLAWLLQNTPVLIWSFFFGLILASVWTVSRRVGVWRPATWVCLLGGIAGTYFLVGLMPVATPENLWFICLCGAVAICAMILPGISGSFILVLLGKYQYVLDAVNSRDFMVLLLFGMGACAGIILFSRVLGWLLSHYHDVMVAILIGLMLGSLRKVWPWKETLEGLVGKHGKVVPLVQRNVMPENWNTEVLMAAALMAVGLITVLVLDRLSTRST